MRAMRALVPLAAVFLVQAPAQAAPCRAEPADTIFHHGRVQTLDRDFSVVDAIAVKNGRILAVGSNDRVLRLYRGCGTRLVDLAGQVVLPGFVDAHTHVFESIFWVDELPSHDVALQQLLDVQRAYLAAGITTEGELNVDPGLPRLLGELDAAGQLLIRISMYLAMVATCGEVANFQRGFAPLTDPELRLRIPGIKIFADGFGAGLNACGQWLATSFPILGFDPPFYGDLFLGQADMDATVQAADAAGWQIAIHTVGDRARDEVLQSYARVLPADGSNPRRHRVEHNSWTRPDQLAEDVELGIVPTVFGRVGTCSIDAGSVLLASAPDLGWLNAYRSMWAAGLRPAWHADLIYQRLLTDGRDLDRVMGDEISGLVTRKQVLPDGEVCEPPDWYAAEAVTAQQALRMVTINAAYALGMDSVVGSLEPGKLADMVLVSDDPLTMAADDLYDLRVRVTIVDGVPRSCATGYEAYCAGL